MADDRIVFIDTETTGLDPDTHDLLEFAAVLWSPEAGIVSTFQASVLPINPFYTVDPEALKINGIDIVQHSERSMTFNEARTKFERFTSKNKLTPPLKAGGINVAFDIAFITNFIVSSEVFYHRVVDIPSIITAMYHSCIIDEPYQGASHAFKKFGICVNGRHTALGDAMASAKLYYTLIERLRKL